MKILILIGAALAWMGFQTKPKAEPKPVYSSTADWDQEPVSFETKTMQPTLDELYQKHGQIHGLDPKLLKAIAQVESSENSLAKNQADPSFGLMQILCQDDGMGSCRNKLNILDWPPANKSKLFDPDYSLHIGAQILAWNIGQYGQNKGIAVYNAWSAHTAPREGPFPNQSYVDKVWAKYGA